MTIDLNTRHETMFKFLPNNADSTHASRLLQMLRSHGVRHTREISPTEWHLLVKRVMEPATQA